MKRPLPKPINGRTEVFIKLVLKSINLGLHPQPVLARGEGWRGQAGELPPEHFRGIGQQLVEAAMSHLPQPFYCCFCRPTAFVLAKLAAPWLLLGGGVSRGPGVVESLGSWEAVSPAPALALDAALVVLPTQLLRGFRVELQLFVECYLDGRHLRFVTSTFLQLRWCVFEGARAVNKRERRDCKVVRGGLLSGGTSVGMEWGREYPEYSCTASANSLSTGFMRH